MTTSCGKVFFGHLDLDYGTVRYGLGPVVACRIVHTVTGLVKPDFLGPTWTCDKSRGLGTSVLEAQLCLAAFGVCTGQTSLVPV